MPRVSISEKCLGCLEMRQFADEMCPAGCPEGRKIEEAFALCYRDGIACRHIAACQSDPRTCGYWGEDSLVPA